jgi:hypothetical protein
MDIGAISLGVRRPDSETDRLTSCSAEVKSGGAIFALLTALDASSLMLHSLSKSMTLPFTVLGGEHRGPWARHS